jgi:hypothetical protein
LKVGICSQELCLYSRKGYLDDREIDNVKKRRQDD